MKETSFRMDGVSSRMTSRISQYYYKAVMTLMPQLTIDEQKERVRRRVNAQIDPEKYEYFPETVSSDHYKSDEFQRVAVYARVSTDDVRQTSSFELQKTYYEEFIARHPKWVLVGIYAGARLGGVAGMLFALPVMMSLRTVFRIFVQKCENI